ncbi:uncharacterized protein [Triticum aestivum]|uniref:uncharacterized protein isoform X3 n=1 Tax=Triticum aestivum TaxID=4565 RepID=UPI001D02B48B|nr:uncharacterized protein LOC123163792 isoform X3 [Triticum aestivum]
MVIVGSHVREVEVITPRSRDVGRSDAKTGTEVMEDAGQQSGVVVYFLFCNIPLMASPAGERIGQARPAGEGTGHGLKRWLVVCFNVAYS